MTKCCAIGFEANISNVDHLFQKAKIFRYVGRLWDGKRYTYDSDGLLTRIQIFKAGRYMGDAVITDDDL